MLDFNPRLLRTGSQTQLVQVVVRDFIRAARDISSGTGHELAFAHRLLTRAWHARGEVTAPRPTARVQVWKRKNDKSMSTRKTGFYSLGNQLHLDSHMRNDRTTNNFTFQITVQNTLHGEVYDAVRPTDRPTNDRFCFSNHLSK